MLHPGSVAGFLGLFHWLNCVVPVASRGAGIGRRLRRLCVHDHDDRAHRCCCQLEGLVVEVIIIIIVTHWNWFTG